MSTVLPHVEKFLSLLKGVKRTANGWEAQCPAHDDKHQSLSVAVKDDGRLLVKCHAGCTGEMIRQALGLQWQDYFSPDHKSGRSEKRIVAVYPYIDADGVLRYEVVRYEPKEFLQRRPDGHGGYIWNLQGVKMLLYCLPELIAADPSLPVFIVEGEKDVDNARKLGLVATCNSGGAAKWEASFNEYFRGRTVVIIADKDKPNTKGERPGAEHAYTIACQLNGIAAKVYRPLELPGGAVKDISDWISAGGTHEQLLAMVADLPVFHPEQHRPPRDKPPEAASDVAASTVGVKLGERDPESGQLVLSPKRTLPTARAYVAEYHDHPLGRTIQNYAGVLWKWRRNRYAELEDEAIRHQLQEWLDNALRIVKRQDGSFELLPFESNPDTIRAALTSIRTYTHIPADLVPPTWLDDNPDLPPARDLLVGRTRVINLHTLRDVTPTPRLFVTSALDFDYDENASKPTQWLKFLDQVLPGQKEEQLLLQQWFGYCLTADTRHQKAMLLIGATRGGKGTVGRVLQQLIGPGNCVAPTIASLTEQFGLQPLIGKSLAVVSDARFVGEKIATVVERLLCIIGEDAITIDRKFLGAVTMKLPTRMMFLSNEFPRLSETSGALAGRFLIIPFTQSFYGREDTGLFGRLCSELPGILNWAIEGWAILQAAGRFIEPESSIRMRQEMTDLLSPVSAFVRERCVIDPQRRAYVDDLYQAWREWCERDGRTQVSTRQSFGRDLQAAVPTVKCRRNNDLGRFYEGIGLSGQGGTELL